MTRMPVILILFAVAGLTAVAQEAAPAPADPVAAAFGAIRAGQLETAEMQLEQIPDPAAKLFVQACVEKAKGDPKRAIQTVTQLIVRYPNDPDWTAKSELMSAELYVQLGMLDNADVTARQIQKLHEGTAAAEAATALREKIANLKAEKESEGSTE